MVFADKFANWYFTKKALPYWCILILDATITYFSFLFSFQQFRSTVELTNTFWPLTINALIYIFFFCIGFRIFRTYSGILRYSSFVDLQRVGYAVLFGTVCSYILHYTFAGNEWLSHLRGREMITASAIATILMWGMRIFVKTIYDVSFANAHSQRAFIYGVKNGGIGIAKNIRSEKPTRFQLMGFVTDEPDTKNHLLMGKEVHFIDDNLVPLMKREKITAFIVSPFRLRTFRNNIKLQNDLIDAGVHIYITQEEKEWNEETGPAILNPQVKEISIEDLLPRDEIQVDMKSVSEQLAGKCIMVTGSAGSIGSEIVRQVASYKPAKLILIDQAETPQHDIRLMMHKDFEDIEAEIIVTSICEPEHMEFLFNRHRPDYVFHAAAYKHVPMMEDNPSESVTNNVMGTRIIADLAVKYGTKKFVMISTDKAVNPTNVMGCSKRICEIYVQALNKELTNKYGNEQHCQFVTTRFGNVLGSNGSVIPLFKEQIKNGGPITVTDPEIIRYFMLIPEACKLVLEAGTKGNGGEIFVFDMGEPVKIADLAKRMIMLSGMPNIKIEFTGLRPGEKLYEEVLNEKELTKPSFHEKIRIAKVREYDYKEVCSDIDDLLNICKNYDNMSTVKKMKQMVPEYRSNNSVYSVIDKELWGGVDFSPNDFRDFPPTV